ncbi:hypothetical protein DID88_003123 [Monilinia fructigena]|uniref:Uncharacterized protein n=1 Tax=Monilinia fructigena TaxID=38457 RepID=A0A395IUF4_9HELO|nr:hypothetical protein DID88_003123 [Monilinia fructigena]
MSRTMSQLDYLLSINLIGYDCFNDHINNTIERSTLIVIPVTTGLIMILTDTTCNSTTRGTLNLQPWILEILDVILCGGSYL